MQFSWIGAHHAHIRHTRHTRNTTFSLNAQAAIRDPNPVVFLESEIGYNEIYELSPEAQSKDYVLDIGKAHIEKEGSDITVLTFSRMVGVALEAAQKAAEKGISVEVVNLRSLRPLDLDTIVNSIKKTNRFVTVEEGWPQCGIGSEIIALANERTSFTRARATTEHNATQHATQNTTHTRNAHDQLS
jgi:pyruvate dehydrogenase E1 component beta subunit